MASACGHPWLSSPQITALSDAALLHCSPLLRRTRQGIGPEGGPAHLAGRRPDGLRPAHGAVSCSAELESARRWRSPTVNWYPGCPNHVCSSCSPISRGYYDRPPLGQFDLPDSFWSMADRC